MVLARGGVVGGGGGVNIQIILGVVFHTLNM